MARFLVGPWHNVCIRKRQSNRAKPPQSAGCAHLLRAWLHCGETYAAPHQIVVSPRPKLIEARYHFCNDDKSMMSGLDEPSYAEPL
jgi:hypothetical protein